MRGAALCRDVPRPSAGVREDSPRHVLVDARRAFQGCVDQELVEDVSLEGQSGRLGSCTLG